MSSSASSESGYCDSRTLCCPTEDEEFPLTGCNSVAPSPPPLLHSRSGASLSSSPSSHSRHRGGRKNRRKKGRSQLPPVAVLPRQSLSSLSFSSPSPPLCDEPIYLLPSSDECIARVYVYFQQLLYQLRDQEREVERLSMQMRHCEDARWGAPGCMRNRYERPDPRGCIVPPIYPNLCTLSSGAFWATPHPAVKLAMLHSSVQEYLEILRRMYPAATRSVSGSRRMSTTDGHHSPGPLMESLFPNAPPPPTSTASGHHYGRPQSAYDLLGGASGGSSAPGPPAGTAPVPVSSASVLPFLMDIVSKSPPEVPMTSLQRSIAAGLMSVPPPPLPEGLQSSLSRPNLSKPPPPIETEPPRWKRDVTSLVNIPKKSTSSTGPSSNDEFPSTVNGGGMGGGAGSRRMTSGGVAPSPHAQHSSSTTAATPSATNLHRGGPSNGGIEGGSSGRPGSVSNSIHHYGGIQRQDSSARSTPSPSSSAGTTISTSSTAASSSTFAGSASSGPSYLHPAAPVPPRSPPTAFVDEGGRFTLSEMDVLSEEIWHFHNSMAQQESTLNRKLHLRDMLYYSISPVFPMCGLYVVGSSLNGFGNNSSDMDLCLMITNKDLDQKTDAVVVLNMILTALRSVEWVAHQQLILAKVPILRIQFTAPFADITVDLNANNSVAIKNTHLLCYYSSFDWRVRPLVTVVKEWAKKKGINDANRSSFTSYSLVLMVLHYLQCGVETPVLPSLQNLYPKRFARLADVRSLNVSVPLPHPSAEEWTFNDASTLGELLIGFLEYYAEKFDYEKHAISVRQGKKIDRALVVRGGRAGMLPHQQGNNWRSQWRCVCIEEPFTYSNTAHSVYDEMTFTAIKRAFREAYRELDTTRDLNRIMNCTPIQVGNNLTHGNGVVVSVPPGSGAVTPAVDAAATASATIQAALGIGASNQMAASSSADSTPTNEQATPSSALPLLSLPPPASSLHPIRTCSASPSSSASSSSDCEDDVTTCCEPEMADATTSPAPPTPVEEPEEAEQPRELLPMDEEEVEVAIASTAELTVDATVLLPNDDAATMEQ